MTMKKPHANQALALALLALAAAPLAFAAQPRAGHSEYLASLTAHALERGVGRESVPVLSPVVGAGREVTARKLLARLGSGGQGFGGRLQLGALSPGQADKRIASYFGKGGYVDVFADGSKLRVRANLDDPKAVAAAGEVALEKAELETLGRRFVSGALRDIVKVSANESVTFLGVRHLVNYEGSVDGRTRASRTIANIAIFGREVGGIPVVGSGSKVAVWFDNARQPVGFDVDWPEYRAAGGTQRVLGQRELAERVAKTTIPLTGENAPRRFECGYVDLGATRRGKSLQAGCEIAWERRGKDGGVSAHVEFVPAAVKVLEDPRWPLAAAIASGETPNTLSAEFAKWVDGPKPPPAPAANYAKGKVKP